MVVATALFSMVVMLSIGSLFVLLDANKKARSLKVAMDNLNLIIDDMARELRLGSKYFCYANPDQPVYIGTTGSENVNDCPYTENGIYGSKLAFRDRFGKVVIYRFDKSEVTPCIQRKITNESWGSGYDEKGVYECLTPVDIVINDLRFYVYDVASISQAQPRILISIKGTAGYGSRTTSSFSVMTSVTQRLPHNVE